MCATRWKASSPVGPDSAIDAPRREEKWSTVLTPVANRVHRQRAMTVGGRDERTLTLLIILFAAVVLAISATG
jgi:hypothetical protein